MAQAFLNYVRRLEIILATVAIEYLPLYNENKMIDSNAVFVRFPVLCKCGWFQLKRSKYDFNCRI